MMYDDDTEETWRPTPPEILEPCEECGAEAGEPGRITCTAKPTT